MKRIIIFAILSFSIFIIDSCKSIPITGRRQLAFVPESMLLDMSLTNYNEFLKENVPVSSGNNDAKLVKNTGGRVASAVQKFLKENGEKDRIKDFKWEFNLVDDPTVNAWCMPGGKVVVYSGIIPVTQNDAGLACVMGHEIAHAVARHGNERMSQQLVVMLGALSLDVALKEKPEQTRQIFNLAYGVGSTLGTLAYSRKQESEADKLGMIFMAMAGYNPAEAITFWERMDAQNQQQVPEFLSTHPSNKRRIEDLKKFLPEAQKYYKP